MVNILILGAGWTSQFLIPQLKASNLKFAATTRDGRESTIPFTFDPFSDDKTPFTALPSAETILVTFPLTGEGQSEKITSLYREVHGESNSWIQLGSTGIFTAPHWNDANSTYSTRNSRAIAEDELLALGGCVLNLSGLYGGTRQPRDWVIRVASTKEQVKEKKALHLIHGDDVARGIIAVHKKFTPGKRWLLTDLRVYDWWDLIQSWGNDVVGRESGEQLHYVAWVGELMIEEDVRALPRSVETLGRVLDSRAFWKEMGVWPSVGSVVRVNDTDKEHERRRA